MNSKSEKQIDSELFGRWVKADEKAFTILYEKYKYRVFSFIVKMTRERELAEDLLQETFLAALRNANQFDPERNFLSWIFGIAHKRTIDYFRHVRVEKDNKAENIKSVGSKLEKQDDYVSNRNIKEHIDEAVKKLDPVQREVFLLRETGGVQFKEIAEIMDCPINTALGRMRLALKNIRAELEKRGVYGVS